jgi:hypothetical protein
MDDTQLTRLRLLESELLHLQRVQAAVAAKTFELHELVCEMLNRELAHSP